MIKRIWVENLPLILLAGAIALSPSFSFGTIQGLNKIIEIRLEDFLLVVLAIIWFINFLTEGKQKAAKPPLFFPILIWLGIGLISVLINLLFGNLILSRGFFYFLKEIEFFLIYFYVFYHLKNIRGAKLIVKLWALLIALNMLYVIYQFQPGRRHGEYGTAAICEWGVFPTGAFFLLLFGFFINLFLYYFSAMDISKPKKWILGLIAVSPSIGVLGSASKTNFLGLVFALILTLFLLILKDKRKFFLFAVLFFIIIISIIFSFKKIPSAVRLFDILTPNAIVQGFIRGRITPAIKPQLQAVLKHPFLPFLGFGKGAIVWSQESHNQYLRNFIETGVIGSIAFLILIFAIIKTAFINFRKSKDSLPIALSAGLFVVSLTMLFISFAVEAFMVVKPSEVYWFFTALTMAVLSFNNNPNNLKLINK